jgi:hypothetical protein
MDCLAGKKLKVQSTNNKKSYNNIFANLQNVQQHSNFSRFIYAHKYCRCPVISYMLRESHAHD